MMNRILFTILLCVCTPVFGQDVPDYWPLEIGNQWIYNHIMAEDGDVQQDETLILRVVALAEIDGTHYFEMSNGKLLRKDGAGNVIEHNQIESVDEVIFDFNNLSDPGYRFFVPYSVFPPGLVGDAHIASPVARYSSALGGSLTRTVPAGTFEAVQFSFGDVSRATNIYFAENVGVLFSESGGHMGAPFESYSLVEYRVGGTTQPTVAHHASWAKIKRSQRDTLAILAGD